MAISTPAFEGINEFNAALAREIDEFLVNASIAARSTLVSTVGATNPITPITSTVNFGIIAAGGAQRNFQITTSITENDASFTPNAGVITD